MPHHDQKSFLALDWLEHFEAAHERLVDSHHRPCIVELATVVGSAENRNQLPFREEFVTVLHHLVSTAHEVHVLLAKEAVHNVGSENVRDTTVVFCPTSDIFVRICPQEVTDDARVWH